MRGSDLERRMAEQIDFVRKGGTGLGLGPIDDVVDPAFGKDRLSEGTSNEGVGDQHESMAR